MNKTCRVIWSHVHRHMVVVSELVSGQGKTQSTRTATGGTGSAFSGALHLLSVCLAIGFGALV
ncbi:MAG: ESPR domain-containing protein, partial [Hydrogenophaga sp.]|nr:ESPR domain-containing protein [Hydrogenophaga sp.]